MLLQILDDGRLTDNQGRVINFENTIIIMTTNAGSQMTGRSLGFVAAAPTALSQSIQSALKDTFRPEFLNRVDEVITFHPLTPEEIRRIADLMLKDIYKSAGEHGIRVHVEDNVKDYLAKNGYDVQFGARPLRRLIQRELEDRISEKYLSGEIVDNDVIRIFLDENGKVTIAKDA